MKFRAHQAIVMAFAALAVGLVPGCSNATNESGAGAAGTQGPAPPDAPKTQEEFARQQLEKYAKAKKTARPAR